MGLAEMAGQFPDLMVTIRLGDLLEANEALARKVREEAEAAGRPDGRRLIPREELAGTLGVDPSTLWRWERQAYLRPVRFGRRVYYLSRDVDAIIESHMEKRDTTSNHTLK